MMVRAFLGAILTILLGLISYALSDSISFSALIVSFFGFVSFLAYRGYKENIAMLAVLMCFFVFLMCRPIVYEFFNLTNQNSIAMEDKTRDFIYACLTVSLISLFFGYIISMRVKKKGKRKNNIINVDFVNSLQSITKKTTVFLYILTLIENILRLFFVKDLGYTASFVSEGGYALPFGLHALIDIAPVSLCLFLATLPKKKDVIIPFALFLVANVFLAISGSRFEIISCILLIVIYAIMRTNYDGEVWIKKKHVIVGLALVPFAIILLQNMTYWRDNKGLAEDRHPFVNFMMGVGGSSDLIGATKQYGENALSADVVYSFGGLWRRIRGNAITELMGGDGAYKHQTIDYAKKGHSLSAAMTYYFFPSRYLSGFGLGGCYIAELYHDFSFIGIIIGNIMIGFIIGLFCSLRNGKVLRNFLCLFLLILFMRIPRDSFDYPMVELIGLKNILYIIIVFVIAKYRATHINPVITQVLLTEDK